MYQNTKAAITLKTNEKAARIASKAKTEEGQGDANTSTPAVVQTSGGGGESRYNLPYYVKVSNWLCSLAALYERAHPSSLLTLQISSS